MNNGRVIVEMADGKQSADVMMCARSLVCVSPGLWQETSHLYCDAFYRIHEELKEQELLLCWLCCNTKLQSPCRCLTPPSALYCRVVETSSVSRVSFPVLGVGKQFTKTVFCYVENWTEEAKIDQALQWLIYGLGERRIVVRLLAVIYLFSRVSIWGLSIPEFGLDWGRFLRR